MKKINMEETSPSTYMERRSPFRHVKTLGLAGAVVALAVAGFIGYSKYQAYQADAPMRSLVAEQAKINAEIAEEMQLRGKQKAEIETHEAAIMAIKAKYDASVARDAELKERRNIVSEKIVAEANKHAADKRGLVTTAEAFPTPKNH